MRNYKTRLLNRICGICRIPADRAVIRDGLCKACRRYSCLGRAVASFQTGAEVVR